MTEPEPLIETTPAPPGMSRSQTGQRWRTPLGDLVEVWQAAPLGRPNDWRWNVKGRNGEIMDHGEGHTRWRNARRAAMRYHPPADPAGELHVVFDGPPGPVAGRFVETENADGQGVGVGRWEERGKYWHLILPGRLAPEAPEASDQHEPPPLALVEKLAQLIADQGYHLPASARLVAEDWALELAPLLVTLPELPPADVETTWPAAWFSYVEDSPDVGAEVLIDGTPYTVAARAPDGVPDRLRVRLTRSEIRRA